MFSTLSKTNFAVLATFVLLYASASNLGLFVWGFYTVSTAFQLFNGNSLQIHVSWTIFNQYLTSPLSRHWQASRSHFPIILSAKGESHFYQFLKNLLSRPGIKPTTSRSRDRRSYHWAIAVVRLEFGPVYHFVVW